LLTILIVALSQWLVMNYYNSFLYKIGYIIIGMVISMAHFLVARANYTQRLNFFTRFLYKQYNREL
jgi:ATP-dependent protease ClpP protease subunit